LISDQCRLLKLSRSGYYRWQQRSLAVSKEMELVKAVLEAWIEHPAFGYRKISHFLGEGFTEKKVRLLYGRLGLRGASQKFKTTRAPKGRMFKFPYLLRNKEILFANQVWATDITYIRLPTGMVYLTVIMDLLSRRILAWRLSATMETAFCLEALHEAVFLYGIPAIFNSDCGSQYLSKEFIGALQGYGIEISMDGVGRCLDNSRVERVWKTVKYEFVFLHEWSSITDLGRGLQKFIDSYNMQRPHEALAYRTPDEVYREGCFQAGDSSEETEVA